MVERRLPRTVGTVAVLLFAAPLAVLVVQAFAEVWRYPALLPQRWGLRGFEVAFEGDQALQATLDSFEVALISTAAAILLAWPAARALARGPARLRTAAIVFLALPLLVPPLATGTGLAEWFIRLGLADTRVGVALAHLTVVLPYVLLVLIPGFNPRLRELEEMAASLGMGPVRRLVSVTLPGIRAVLAAAALLGFLVSWSQYGSSLAVGGGLPMLPLTLLPFVGSDPNVAAALSLLFLAPAVLALLLASRAAREAL
ncbi:MAG: ABC transporter permease [Actinobacteria bacterium]|nr:ABC transporter permease [Actinomycetota bacterium]